VELIAKIIFVWIKINMRYWFCAYVTFWDSWIFHPFFYLTGEVAESKDCIKFTASR